MNHREEDLWIGKSLVDGYSVDPFNGGADVDVFDRGHRPKHEHLVDVGDQLLKPVFARAQ